MFWKKRKILSVKLYNILLTIKKFYFLNILLESYKNMIELHFTLFEALLIMIIFTIIFFYSITSADLLSTLFSFMIFLILILPFYILIEECQFLIFENDLQNVFFLNIFYNFSIFITIFIGFFLFVQLLYLFFNS